MNKYFIQFNSAAGNLAVEKHLHSFIKDKYDHATLPENFIQTLKDDLEREQRAFFLEHRGKPINIEYHPTGVNGNYFLNAGSIGLILILIQHEY